MTLWTSADAAGATGGRATTGWAATGISIDTRTIRPGDLFVALKDARDGHDFVAQALDKGAAAALVSRVPEGVSGDAPLLIVPDVLPALEALGRAGRARTGARVLAITGSVGKTSTKDMAAAALSGQGRVHAAEASLNNHWGVPLTLARMPRDTDFAILELGMNHPGEIAPLSRMARPHVAMITTVAPAHMEAFGSLEGIAREKGAIVEGLAPAGHAILPEDLTVTPILRDAADAAAAIVVGFGRDGAARPLRSDVTADGTTQVRARILGETVDFTLASARLRADTEFGALEWEGPLSLFAVCNGMTVGGGRPLAPAACISDGLLDVFFVREVSTTGLAALLLKMGRGAHLEDERVFGFRARNLSFEFEGPTPVNVDGEVAEVERAVYRVHHHATRILMPDTGAAAASSQGEQGETSV